MFIETYSIFLCGFRVSAKNVTKSFFKALKNQFEILLKKGYEDKKNDALVILFFNSVIS